jgi:SAM-dependent methyltransferase
LENVFVKNWKNDYAPDEIERVLCPLCGGDETRFIAKEWSLGIEQCTDCDLVFVNPRIKDPEKNYWFDEESVLRKYASVFAGGPHDRDRNYSEHGALLRRLKPRGRLLDVGTHCGFFLRVLKEGEWELHGIEPSPVGAKLARERFGLNVKEGYLEAGGFEPRTFDIVTVLDVIEHVTNPLDFLGAAYDVLKVDGILLVKTPNLNWIRLKHRVRSLGLRKNFSGVFDSREHVVQYSQESLAKMLSVAGFDVEFFYVPLPVQTRGQRGRWWRMPLRSIAYRLARISYLFGAVGIAPDLGVVARKPIWDRA